MVEEEDEGAGTREMYDERAPAFKPFERIDYYGKMGRSIASNDGRGSEGRAWRWLLESLRLSLAAVTILPIRLLLVFIAVSSYYIVCSAIVVLSSVTGNGISRIWWVRQAGIIHARLLLFILGFLTIDVDGNERNRFAYDEATGRVVQLSSLERSQQYQQQIPGQDGNGGSVGDERSGLLQSSGVAPPSTNTISNHISWLDIPVHMVVSECPAFVSKSSVRRAPVIGSLAELMGCLFVDRENTGGAAAAAADGEQRTAAPRAVGTGASALVRERMISNANAGQSGSGVSATENTSLVVFPEGTTTNGRFLLPFHKSSFIASVPVRMVVLEYRSARLSLAWDSIPALRHFLLLCCQPINHVRVSVIGSYVPGDSEKGAAGVATCASRVRTIMAENAGLALSSSSLKEKRLYHKILLKSS